MYTLELSKKDETYKGIRIVDKEVFPIIVSIRDMEIEILGVLMIYALNEYSKISDINICNDFINVLDNVSKEDTNINYDKADLNNLTLGVEKSKGKRTGDWGKCHKLFKQLGNPKEIKI